MYLPAAHQADDFIAGLFQGQTFFDNFGIIFGQSHAAGIAEKIRRMQKVYMESVAFNPFAAVE